MGETPGLHVVDEAGKLPGDAVQPGAERLPLAIRARHRRPHQERDLDRLRGSPGMAQHATADPQHGRAMPSHVRRLISACNGHYEYKISPNRLRCVLAQRAGTSYDREPKHPQRGEGN
jgi:hypothetical protein